MWRYKEIRFLYILVTAFVLTILPKVTCAAGLSGTYDICPSCAYTSISAAATDLNSKGVSGAVVFTIHAGTYTDFASLKNISGSSAANTIVFTGKGVDSTVIKASYTFLLSLVNVHYITFKNMTLRTDTSGQTIVISSSSYITFDHCRIKATSYLSKASLKAYGISMQDADHFIVSNCRFEGGYNSIVSFGSATTGNNAIYNNSFAGFYTIGISTSVTKQSGNVYTSNVFDSSLYTSGAPYGISVYYENGLNIGSNRCMNCGITAFNLNNNSEANTAIIANNYVYSNVKQGVLMDISFSNGNVLVAHNTLYATPKSYPDHGFYAVANGSGKNIRILNNLFDIERQCLHKNIYIDGPVSDHLLVDGNDYYTGGVAMDSVYFFGRYYRYYTDLYKDAKSMGYEVYSSNLKPVYKTTGDVHLDTTVAAPTGVYAGVDKDIDGDARCSIAPTVGADESRTGKYDTPAAFISGPDTVYDRTPALFVDTSAKNRQHSHKWYVNGKAVSDSLALRTDLARYPSVTISLVTNSCNGVDSISKTFNVIYPSKAPVTDFEADHDSVKMRGIVHFNDLSINAPTHWKWQISQDMNAFHGINKIPFRYIKSSDTSQNLTVQFLSPGKYHVCLTTSNVLKNGKIGQGNTVCKEDYIYVQQFSPVLSIAGPDTIFGGVNKASKSSINAQKILSALDSAGYAVADTFFPASVPLNKVDTVMITYIATDDIGDSVVDYRWVVVYDTTAPVLYLVGSDTEIVELNSLFTDSGVSESDNYYPAYIMMPLIKVNSDVNTSQCGIYRIVYSVKDPSGNMVIPVTRIVIVQDTVPPKISIIGNQHDTVLVNTMYNDSASVLDNDDKNVKLSRSGSFYDKFPSGKPDKLGTYSIIYKAKDKCGNIADSVVRKVTVVDTLPPVIKLIGSHTASVCQGKEYTDSGYTISDNYWNLVLVDTEGTFFIHGTDSLGIYTWRYKAIDRSGNVGYSAYRYIEVKDCKDAIYGRISDASIFIYPNPATCGIFIKSHLDNNFPVYISITDIMGKIVYKSNASLSDQGIYTIDLQQMSAGLYSVNIASNEGTVSRKIIVTRK